MNAKTRFWTAIAPALVAALIAAPALAAEAEAPAPGPMTSTWIFWPADGQAAAFEAGVKAHAAWRKGAGEGWTWRIYEPVVGADMAHYVVRSVQHHWADFDAQAAWEESSGSLAKYMEQVGGSVARFEHYLGEWGIAHSKWEQSEQYVYFGVSHLTVRPGARGELMEGLAKIHKAAVDQKWPKSYGIEWRIGGGGEMLLIFPAKSYADMAEPDPAFMKYLADSLGSKEAAAETMKSVSGSFTGDDYTIYRYRPDLSTPE